MSFSIFSSKKSVDQKDITPDVEISRGVRTMQDDLSDLKNQDEKKPSPVRKDAKEVKVVSLKETEEALTSKQQMNPFSKEADKLLEEQTALAIKNAKKSPEITLQTEQNIHRKIPQQKSMNGVVPMAPILKKTPLVEKSQGGSRIFLVSGIVAALLLLVSVGGYYYLVLKKTTPTVEIEVPIENIPNVVEQVPVKELPYALDKPNYLSLNTEAVSSEEIQKILLTTASRIKEVGITQPVEFLVTDQNNNPLAFGRFALLLKMSLSPTVLAQIDEPFSLYIYNDAGSMRVGLNLTLMMNEKILPTLSAIENTLPSAFQTLLLEPNVIVPKTMDFKSNVYTALQPTSPSPDGVANQEFALRYANIDIARKVSIDYSVVGNHWYVGTSRNTLIALLNAITK